MQDFPETWSPAAGFGAWMRCRLPSHGVRLPDWQANGAACFGRAVRQAARA